MSGQATVQTQITTKPTITLVASGLLQRQCACGQHTSAGEECEACKQKREGALQRAAVNPPPVHEVPPIVHEGLHTPGQPLDAATRAFMEPRFGHDFSGVRVHTDAKAAESARAVNALAYTVGRDVVFGAGQYAPRSSAGQRLMAHELTHVVQQQGHGGNLQPYAIGPSDGHLEREASAAAEAVTTGRSLPSLSPTSSSVQRQDAGADGGNDAGTSAPDVGVNAPDAGGTGGTAPSTPGGPTPTPAAPTQQVTDITVANQADAITYPEPSVLGAAGRKHFVTVAGSGPDVIIEATVTPGGAVAPGSIMWTGATPDAGNPARATVSRARAAKREVTASAGGGSASLTVWAVFASITRVNGPTLGITPPTLPGAGVNCAGTSLCIWATINNDAEIFPKSIITDADRPNLAGASTVAVPGGTSPCLGGLGGGATLRWDFSRQTNISFEPKFAGVCVNTTFPGNNAEGNDDTNVDDEMNDPYAGGTILHNGRAVAAGFVGDMDAPKDPLTDAQGVPGDTDFMTATFREFVRLEYHRTWWLISHRPTWSINFRARKNAANHWVDDGSTVA